MHHFCTTPSCHVAAWFKASLVQWNSQPSIAKLEKRTDMYISTLRCHVEAMGGQLEVIEKFPDGNVKISNFSDLGKAAVV